MTDTAPEIERINALTVNARNTWFVLLGALVFVGITLMGVEHIDFYGVDRATTLPLVNVEVPTRFFFVAAPMLVAAIYGYFHLYLIRLWDALSVAPARIDDRPLGDVISPWLVTDAALHLRARMRGDACTTPRAIEGAAMLLNIALAWVFGLLVLALLWWQSMPARDVLMTGLAGAALAAGLFMGGASLAMMVLRMQSAYDGTRQNIFSTAPAMGAVLVLVPCIGIMTEVRTMGDNPDLLAPITMVDEPIVERPTGWLPYGLARDAFRDAWCERKAHKDCAALSEDAERAFATEWEARRRATLADMRRPYWSDRTVNRQVNWHGADLRAAFLVGANLRRAKLEGAILSGAQMEGANLREAQFVWAILYRARMERANLSSVQMANADLSFARMEGADLFRAQIEGANFRGAQVQRADFRAAQIKWADFSFARMEGTNLRKAQMQGASFRKAQMEGANFSGAQMEGVDISEAQMEGADLSLSHIVGLTDRPLIATSINLSAAKNSAGALRFLKLSDAIWDDRTDFRNAFLDASVIMPEAFRTRMGTPCQWVTVPLSDADFYAVWRWWIETTSQSFLSRFSTPAYLDIPPATPELLAKLGLTNCKPGQPFGPMPTD